MEESKKVQHHKNSNNTWFHRILQPLEITYKFHILAVALSTLASLGTAALGWYAHSTLDPKIFIVIIAILAGLYLPLVVVIVDIKRRSRFESFLRQRTLLENLEAIQADLEAKSTECEQLHFRLKKYEVMEEYFGGWAQSNQAFDKRLLDLLYADFNPEQSKIVERIDRLIELTKQHTHSLVTTMGSIYQALTECRCGITIKYVRCCANKSPAEWVVETIQRDSNSAFRSNNNHGSNRPNTVAQNTDTEILFVTCEQDYFACDDLSSIVDYKNHNKNWRRYYKAALVLRVETAIQFGVDSYPIPILCIDNLRGGLNSETSINYAKEFSCRLAVLHDFEQKLINLRGKS